MLLDRCEYYTNYIFQSMKTLLLIVAGLVRSQEDVQVSCDPDSMQIRITKGL